MGPCGYGSISADGVLSPGLSLGCFLVLSLQVLLYGLVGENKLRADVQGLGAWVPRHVQRVQPGERGHGNPPCLPLGCATLLAHQLLAKELGLPFPSARGPSLCHACGTWTWVAVPWDVPWEEGAASSTQLWGRRHGPAAWAAAPHGGDRPPPPRPRRSGEWR